MENVSNDVAANSPGQSDYQNHNNYNRQREKQPQRPYSDLREVLNKKRQSKEESKFNGPPSEPKFNFLSDPSRDNDISQQEHHGSVRFQQSNSEFRGRGARGRGRGRGRGHFQYNNNYRPNYRKNEELKDNAAEQNNSEDNNQGDTSRDNDNSKYKPNAPYRPYQRRSYPPRKNDQINNPENSVPQATHTETEEKYHRQDSSSANYKPRRNFPPRGRTPYRYNPRFRGHHQKRNPKPLDPVNISVEYSVDSGTRKCTIEKQDSAKEEKQELPKCVEVECEENWDEADKNEDETETENQDEQYSEENKEESEEKADNIEENKNQAKDNLETPEVEKDTKTTDTTQVLTKEEETINTADPTEDETKNDKVIRNDK